MLVAGGILVAGNSFLHFQYGPSTRLRLSALVLTLIGFSGMVLANRLFLRDNARLSLVNQETFYVFLFAIFVILPTVYGNPDGPTALFLWFTTTILLGVFLFLRHPILHGRRKLV